MQSITLISVNKKEHVVDPTQYLVYLTGPSTPSGHTAIASSTYSPGSYNAWKAFNGSKNIYGWYANGSLPQTLTRGFLEPIKLSAYKIYPHYWEVLAHLGPAAWTLQGSNNNSTWINIDNRSGQTYQPLVEPPIHIIQTPNFYKFYRWTFTKLFGSGTPNYVGMNEITLFI